MKKNPLLKLAGVLLLAFALTASVKAIPINGSIGFSGIFSTDNNSNFTAATQFTSFTSTSVLGTSGDYAIVTDGTAVTFTPFSFSASGVTPLWSFGYGPLTYSFDATTVSVTTTTNSIIAEGAGYAYITGFDATPGTWIITSNGAGASFTFSASSTVPDGGTTALLVGLGLVGMGLFVRRRQLAK